MKPRHVIIALVVVFVGLNLLIVGGYLLLRRERAPGASPVAAGRSVLLVAPEGKHYVGEQLRFFVVDQDGVIDATNTAWLYLYHTEGEPFRLNGEVWLAEPAQRTRNGDMPDGFALFLREWDSLHRYSLTTRSMDLKRRLHGGRPESGIIQIVLFEPPVSGAWIAFEADVSAEGISFRIGGQSGLIPGPLDMDGANKFALAPGTRLRNLRLEITEPKN